MSAILAVGCGGDDDDDDDSSGDGTAIDANTGAVDASDSDGTPPSDGSIGDIDAGAEDDGSGDDGGEDDGGEDDGGDIDAGPAVDLTGTWFAELSTTGTITAPVIGSLDTAIDIAIRVVVTRDGDNLDLRGELCRLDTNAAAAGLVVNFPATVLQLFVDDATIPEPNVPVGGSVALPDLSFRAGQDAAGNQVDDDGNKLPGVTIPVSLGGTAVAVHAGFSIALSFSQVTLVAADSQTGQLAFTTEGNIFDTDPLDLTGALTVTPATPTTAFTAARRPGDVSCSELLDGR